MLTNLISIKEEVNIGTKQTGNTMYSEISLSFREILFTNKKNCYYLKDDLFDANVYVDIIRDFDNQKRRKQIGNQFDVF